MPKIQAPNVTYIPNVIFDYWMERLTAPEFKVLLAICRKTFGWHKTKDKISIGQIEEKTGLCRRTVIYAIKVLEGHDLIKKEHTKIRSGRSGINIYEINVQEVHSKGVQEVHPPSASDAPTKETITKEKIDIPNGISSPSPKKGDREHKKKQVLLNREKGEFEGLDEEKLLKMKKVYPYINAAREIEKIKLWLEENPKGKRRKGTWKFILDWFSRASDNKEYQQNKKAKPETSPKKSEYSDIKVKVYT